MSEEKPTFKVTDRRLFNPDGTPREDAVREERIEAPEPPEAVTQTAAPTSPVPPTTSGRAPESTTAQSQSGAARSRREPAQTASSASQAGAGAQSDAGVDPTPFANLVMFIASPAAAAMGMTEHPGLAPGELDLPLAKHCIELLATVREKTRGNLSAQESEIIESLLAELRMQYVSLTSARPAPPRSGGFTGGDITGGR